MKSSLIMATLVIVMAQCNVSSVAVPSKRDHYKHMDAMRLAEHWLVPTPLAYFMGHLHTGAASNTTYNVW